MHDVGTFGDLLRRYRTASGLGQEDLARKARVSAESISALERGVRRAPYHPTVDQLSRALELSGEERRAFEEAAATARSRKSRRRHDGREVTSPNNLPAGRSSFVGRDRDIAKLVASLHEHRLVTITGSGGVGKTRVAIETARAILSQNPREVWFIDLASLGDGTLLAGAIARSIEPPLAGRFETISSLAVALVPRKALLILDNCEHLIDDVALAAHHILQICPGISLLATSRERLNISGEAVYRLPSLASPSHWPRNLAEARRYGAVALLIDRAESVGSNVVEADPSLEKVVDLCRRVDGIPLAIEMAVAHLPSLGLSTLCERLAESLPPAGDARDKPMRHQTMLATITWSYALLGGPEQALLRRLAIFVGGFTLAAAESVCVDPPIQPAEVPELLASLVDKSLVTVTHAQGNARYRLPEALRAFALSKLDEAGEETSVARLHARWVCALADTVRPSTLGDLPKAAAVTSDLDNARAALAWCNSTQLPDDVALGAKIVIGLAGLWSLSGRHAESEQIARRILTNLDEEKFPLEAALLSGMIVTRSWARPTGRLDLERAIALFERVGRPSLLVQVYSMLTFVYSMIGELEEAESAAKRAIQLSAEEGMEDTLVHADILASRSKLRAAQGRLDEARADLSAASAIASRLGNEFYVVAMCLPRLAEVELKAGNLARAISLAEEMLSSDVGSVQQMVTLEALGFLACLRLHLGDTEAAEIAARRQLELGRGDETMAIEYLATIAAMRGNAEKAARLCGFVHTLLAEAPILGVSYQRTSDLLSRSLQVQLTPEDIASQVAIGARYSLWEATVEALDSEQ